MWFKSQVNNVTTSIGAKNENGARDFDKSERKNKQQVSVDIQETTTTKHSTSTFLLHQYLQNYLDIELNMKKAQEQGDFRSRSGSLGEIELST